MEMEFIKERISKLILDLKDLVYEDEKEIKHYKMLKTDKKIENFSETEAEEWEDFDCRQIWGGHREYYLFETNVDIPKAFEGKTVVYEITTGKEGEWDATNPQFSLYVNGKMLQGMDVNHREVVLTECAKYGEKFSILLAAFTGDQNFSLLLRSKIKILNREIEKYYYDCEVPYQVMRMLEKDSPAYLKIITNLNESLNLLDLRRIYSREFFQSLKKAQEYLTVNFYEKECGYEETKVYCVGHTHIDVAWLWTLAVTKDKAVRSFSTVLQLMKEYPEYIFMSSQPQLYKYVKENAPEVYAELKKMVQEGRWEPEGGMFLEADCNITSGEALVRQFLVGQRFFENEFGKRSKILWLPDVFGYSVALPQIMKKSGIDYFMTTKISWNETNKMPYDTFLWEGIDGTEVLTHFIPSRDYKRAAVEGGFETEFFTTYNGILNPSQIKGGWERYSQKYLNSEVLMSFGYGDGGGGPTKEMLENYKRLNKGIPGCPKAVMSTAGDFFELLSEKVKTHKYLPKWVGELYLEYHRGTYTSMARNKRFNRKAEFLLENSELYSVLDDLLLNGQYPEKQLCEAWEIVLRNQFHDILPGSSIKEVYEDSDKEYANVFEIGNECVTNALKHIADNIDADEGNIVVFNPGISENVNQLISVKFDNFIENPMIFDGERTLYGQCNENNELIFVDNGLPVKGYKTYAVEAGDCNAELNRIIMTKDCIENRFFSIKINSKGQFTSIYDKTNQRELLKKNSVGNVLMTYEDRPHNYDAWDINNYYVEKSWMIDDECEITIEENGPVRGVISLKHTYLDSTIIQKVILYNDIDRIDIQNTIDWKERQILLKNIYPLDVHTNEATFDIQYGNVKRPTHKNTSWDRARFEVCVHKWLDVAESDYGVSFINDCKYGCNVDGTTVGLTMLKSAVFPNPEADREIHQFTYAIYPHKGEWKEASTVEYAYALNNEVSTVVKTTVGGTLPKQYRMFSVSEKNIVAEVVKKADKSGDTVIRLFEDQNKRTKAHMTFAHPVEKIFECNLLEEEIYEIASSKDGYDIEFQPYEIKTLKIRWSKNSIEVSK